MPNKRQEDLATVHFGKLEPQQADSFIERSQAAGITADAMDWIPNRRVLRLIPLGFRLPLQVVRGADGLRRILPRCTAREFLVRAATGGLAVMQRVRKLTKDDRQSYRLMSLLFQWSFSDRRLMSRRIRRTEDLRLRQSERGGDSDRDILPDIEATNHLDKTKRLTPEELLRCGRQSARERGVPAEDVSHQIHLGLLEMAHHSSVQTNALCPEVSAAIIRISLFGLEQGERTNDAELKALVEERMIQAVQKHLDLPNKEFSRWMWKDFDNIVQQLAKRTNKQGGPVSRPRVRYILFDLLWRSFGYVSQCVRMQMQAVRQAIQPPLTDQERRVFGLWYDSQPWTAGLAPIMLHNRLGLLLPTLADLEDCDPGGDHPWRAFLQAMQWSVEMTANRRSADVIQKHGKSFSPLHAFDDEDLDLAESEADDDDDWIVTPARRRDRPSRRRSQR